MMPYDGQDAQASFSSILALRLVAVIMLPYIRSIAGDAYVFQQDSTPAHRARQMVELFQRETPKFISPDLWPPNNPDLNTVDYGI